MSKHFTAVPPPREIEVSFGNGVVGTLVIPHALDSPNPFVEDYAPGTNKAAIIVHGQSGHRNYCYQRHLAHRLAADLGIYSLRFDFRGCGDSADNADPTVGRPLEQDVEDIQAAAEFLLDATRNLLNTSLAVSSIIGHSRGSVAMFLWALEQDRLLNSADSSRAIVVPNLVNCSARYRLYTVFDRYSIEDVDTAHDFYPLEALRYGKKQQVLIPREELRSIGSPDLSVLRQLSPEWSVLSVYGLEDRIIPIEDSALYANVLNRGYDSHQLKLIPRADHNFYGVKNIASAEDAADHNPLAMPLNKRGVANYNYIVSDTIIEYLRPANELNRFVSTCYDVGKLPRWKIVDGVNNFRDMGGWHIHLPTFALPEAVVDARYYVKPHVLFRCANTASITETGLRAVHRLGIKAVFDLRSDGECLKDGNPQGLEKYGIQRIHAPVFSKDDYSPQSIAVRYTHLLTSWYTYVNVYDNILEFGTSSFRTIFEYIRDVNQPFLFHCTAGKDRTGIFGMLVLLLLGVDKITIAKEYELTTIGLQPEHANLKKKFVETVAKLKEKMKETVDIEEAIGQGRKGWSVEEDGFQNLISSRSEAMLATVEMFNSKYGGIVAYMKNNLGFSQDDIIKIYKNLVVYDGGFESNSILNWEHRNGSKAKI